MDSYNSPNDRLYHQLPFGKLEDELMNGGHVTDASGTNVQSRDPQTPVATPGDLALTQRIPGHSGRTWANGVL